MERSLSILSQLGNGVENNLTQDHLDLQIHRTLSFAINGGLNLNVGSYKVMTDANKLMSMRFLAQSHILTMFAHLALLPFVVLKMIQLTAAYGLSPEAPIGLACFGSMLCKRGKMQLGCNFTKLAKSPAREHFSRHRRGAMHIW